MKKCNHEKLKTGYLVANILTCEDCNSEWAWNPFDKHYKLIKLRKTK